MDARDAFNLTAIGLVAAGGIALGGISAVYVAQPDETVRFTVSEKLVKPGKESSKYLVMTDKGVFENTDSWTRWKFNSSDVHNEIRPGCTYDATVFGFRNNFLSAYKDILEVKHVPTDACPTPQGPKAPK